MDDLIRLALENDGAYQSAEIRVQQAQTAVRLATIGTLPQAGVEVTAGLPANDTMAGNLIALTVKESLSVPLLNIFGTKAAGIIEVAMWDLGNAVLSRNRKALETRASVYQSVLDVLEAKAVLESSQRALTVAQGGLERTRRLIELGTATRLDELSYRTSVLNAQANIGTAQDNLRTALEGLERLVGQPVEVDKLPAGFAGEPHDIPRQSGESLLPKALELSPDVAVRAIALQKAKRSLALLRNDYRPQVTVSGTASTDGASARATLNLTTGEISWSTEVMPGQWFFQPAPSPGAGDGLSANVKVLWNLWDWGAARLRVSQAEQDVRLAEVALNDTKQSAGLALQGAVDKSNAACRRWLTAREKLALAQEKLRLQQVRSDLGVVAVQDLIAAEEGAADAQTALVQAQYEWVSSILVLDQAAGLAPVVSRF